MGTMESLPQEFHQELARNAKHNTSKMQLQILNPYRQTKIAQPLSGIMSFQDFSPSIDKAHEEKSIQECLVSDQEISIILSIIYIILLILDAFHAVSASVLNRVDFSHKGHNWYISQKMH